MPRSRLIPGPTRPTPGSAVEAAAGRREPDPRDTQPDLPSPRQFLLSLVALGVIAAGAVLLTAPQLALVSRGALRASLSSGADAINALGLLPREGHVPETSQPVPPPALVAADVDSDSAAPPPVPLAAEPVHPERQGIAVFRLKGLSTLPNAAAAQLFEQSVGLLAADPEIEIRSATLTPVPNSPDAWLMVAWKRAPVVPAAPLPPHPLWLAPPEPDGSSDEEIPPPVRRPRAPADPELKPAYDLGSLVARPPAAAPELGKGVRP